MTTVQDDIAKLVRGLSPAQRAAIVFEGLPPRKDMCFSRSMATASVLHLRGIIERPSYEAPFTPLGLLVRDHLLSYPTGREADHG